MAIAINQTTIGDFAADSSGTTVAFTTNAVVASGGFIVITVSWAASGNDPLLSEVTGGGLTWVIDKQGNIGAANCSAAVVSAQAPSGLASGTTITATFSASSAGGRSIAGTSFTGVATSSAVDTTDGPLAPSGTAWTTNSISILAGSVIVAVSVDFNSLATSEVTSPSLEAHDFGAGNFSQTTCYRIESSAGSYVVAGTWSATTSNFGNICAVAYKAAVAQIANPSADSVDNAWTDQAGGSSLAAAIDEDSASDTDYIRSPAGPQDSGCRVKLESLTDPASSSGHAIHWRIAKDLAGGDAISMTVKLYQGGGDSLGGGTLIADFVRSGADVDETFTTFDEALSAGEADSITNYGDLYLEFWADTA